MCQISTNGSYRSSVVRSLHMGLSHVIEVLHSAAWQVFCHEAGLICSAGADVRWRERLGETRVAAAEAAQIAATAAARGVIASDQVVLAAYCTVAWHARCV